MLWSSIIRLILRVSSCVKARFFSEALVLIDCTSSACRFSSRSISAAWSLANFSISAFISARFLVNISATVLARSSADLPASCCLLSIPTARPSPICSPIIIVAPAGDAISSAASMVRTISFAIFFAVVITKDRLPSSPASSPAIAFSPIVSKSSSIESKDAIIFANRLSMVSITLLVPLSIPTASPSVIPSPIPTNTLDGLLISSSSFADSMPAFAMSPVAFSTPGVPSIIDSSRLSGIIFPILSKPAASICSFIVAELVCTQSTIWSMTSSNSSPRDFFILSPAISAPDSSAPANFSSSVSDALAKTANSAAESMPKLSMYGTKLSYPFSPAHFISLAWFSPHSSTTF